MLEVDAGSPIWLGGVDIVNCFYTLELPTEFRGYFALLRVRAQDVGVAAVADGVVGIDGVVYPCLKVVPMGWNQALMAFRIIYVAMVTKLEGISTSNMMVDGLGVPSMRPM
eukprot:6895167-Pyramimonas_sp.AAC.1